MTLMLGQNIILKFHNLGMITHALLKSKVFFWINSDREYVRISIVLLL